MNTNSNDKIKIEWTSINKDAVVGPYEEACKKDLKKQLEEVFHEIFRFSRENKLKFKLVVKDPECNYQNHDCDLELHWDTGISDYINHPCWVPSNCY